MTTPAVLCFFTVIQLNFRNIQDTGNIAQIFLQQLVTKIINSLVHEKYHLQSGFRLSRNSQLHSINMAMFMSLDG